MAKLKSEALPEEVVILNQETAIASPVVTTVAVLNEDGTATVAVPVPATVPVTVSVDPVQAKVLAGLTREQAEAVVAAQAKHDATIKHHHPKA